MLTAREELEAEWTATMLDPTPEEMDSWEKVGELMDRWSEAGGTANMKVAMPFRKQAEKMQKRLLDTTQKEPAECWSGCDDPYCPYTH